MNIVSRFRQNRGQIDKRQDKRRGLRGKMMTGGNSGKRENYKANLSPDLMAATISEISEKYKKDSKRNVMISVISFLLAGGAVLLLWKNFTAILFGWLFGIH